MNDLQPDQLSQTDLNRIFFKYSNSKHEFTDKQKTQVILTVTTNLKYSLWFQAATYKKVVY